MESREFETTTGEQQFREQKSCYFTARYEPWAPMMLLRVSNTLRQHRRVLDRHRRWMGAERTKYHFPFEFSHLLALFKLGIPSSAAAEKGVGVLVSGWWAMYASHLGEQLLRCFLR
jgi:hypothetical protein